MKIAIHQPRISYYTGGGEIIPLMQAKYLSKLKHKVTIVTTKQQKPSDIYDKWKKTEKNITFVELKVPQKHAGLYQEEAGISRIRWDYECFAFNQMSFKFYQTNNFNLIASHYLVDALGIPPHQTSVLHLHGYPKHNNLLNQVFMKFPDAVIGVSKFVLDKWSKLTSLPAKKYVCYNGVESPKKFSIKSVDNIDLLFVGRLIPRKGVQYAIEALEKLNKQGISAHLTIVGIGPMEKELTNIVKKRGLEKFVAFKGLCSHNQVLSFFKASNFCLFPSFEREGMPTAILEAMSLGKVVVATNNFGMKELIVDGKDGILIPERNSLALARAITSLKLDKEKTRKIGKNAAQKINRNWLWSTQIKKLEKTYFSILA